MDYIWVLLMLFIKQTCSALLQSQLEYTAHQHMLKSRTPSSTERVSNINGINWNKFQDVFWWKACSYLKIKPFSRQINGFNIFQGNLSSIPWACRSSLLQSSRLKCNVTMLLLLTYFEWNITMNTHILVFLMHSFPAEAPVGSKAVHSTDISVEEKLVQQVSPVLTASSSYTATSWLAVLSNI